MPKFYVQCGSIETILSSDSFESAALAALDRTLQAHLWIYDDADLDDQTRHDHLMLEALLHLEPTIRISERGWNRSDAIAIGTPETVDQWHRLMVGMNRLFASAGLLPRSMAEVAGYSIEPAVPPRRPR